MSRLHRGGTSIVRDSRDVLRTLAMDDAYRMDWHIARIVHFIDRKNRTRRSHRGAIIVSPTNALSWCIGSF